MDAQELKQRYQARWRLAADRERLVLFLLNQYYKLPRLGFLAALTGLGSGLSDYIPRSYASLEEAFDITVYRVSDWKPVAFVDVTGVRSPHDHVRGLGLCVGKWKVWKAEKYGVLDRVWMAHVDDEGPRVRWASLAYLAEAGEERRMVDGERPYICLDSRKWRPTRTFIEWLVGAAGNADTGVR